MPRRVPITLARLLAVACACLVPAAGARAAAPANDLQSGAQAISNMSWTSLSTFQDIVVQATEWSSATTGPEDADPLPSCTSIVGFRSMWYSILVPEAAVLRVAVTATDNRYEPVVTIVDPNREEVGCGRANASKPGSAANATAYVAPKSDGTPTMYLVRVAEFADNSASAGLPTVLVRFAARDVTAPHIRVNYVQGAVAPGAPTTYDATETDDAASQVNPASARWEFHDKVNGQRVTRTRSGNVRESYRWVSPGAHDVVFRVADFAGNESMYRFTTFVQDTVRPDVKFSLRPPEPGDRRLRITIRSSESVHVRLLVTQAGRAKPLMRRVVNFWGDKSQARSVPLRGPVRKGLLVISGFARDLAGNTTALPQCVVDPVTGQGRCTSP